MNNSISLGAYLLERCTCFSNAKKGLLVRDSVGSLGDKFELFWVIRKDSVLLYKMTFRIDFQVKCRTAFGEVAIICGNLPELGEWNPSKGLVLETNEAVFPIWTSKHSLMLR
jgi:hypothetical protein